MAETFENLTVLLVDDEPFMRQLVERLLYDMGILNIIMACDGADAVEKLSASGEQIDLMILDLEMPNMNGFQVVQQVRKGVSDINPELPIIILTGHGQLDAVKAAVKLGVHGYLVKPMSRAALEKRIKIALSSGTIDPDVLPS